MQQIDISNTFQNESWQVWWEGHFIYLFIFPNANLDYQWNKIITSVIWNEKGSFDLRMYVKIYSWFSNL
jgi:hypothetical protein